MSKIHQAIRRAEAEGRQMSTFGVTWPRRETLTIKENIPSSLDAKQASLDPLESMAFSKMDLPSDCYLATTESLGLPFDHQIGPFDSTRSFSNEQFRLLAAKLCQMRAESRLQTILVTSAASQEGKTLTSINLAKAIARDFNAQVLLVDANLRTPSLHRIVGLTQKEGLAEVLTQDYVLDSLIEETVPKLFFLQAGSKKKATTQSLGSKVMKDFLSQATDKFRWIILDSAPVLNLRDTLVMSGLIDGILLVVRARQTSCRSIQRTLEKLQGKRVLGVVFNGSSIRQAALQNHAWQ